MFHFLATTNCKRQQIAILIITLFAYVAGIRNEGNNMLLQQQELQQQQQTTIENSNNESRVNDIKQASTFNFRPSQVIDFTPADAALPQQFKPTYIETPHSTNNDEAMQYNGHKNTRIDNNVPQKQETQTSNRRYAIEAAATYGIAAEKPFSFPNEQQQIPQHLTDKPIYIYKDPFTNENYHYTPTETNVRETTAPTTYNHNNYKNDAYKQPKLHQHLQHYDDNQEYLVQSSMTVGTYPQQQQINPLRPYMSLSADKDVYLKRPGFVYDEKPSQNVPNSVTDKKSQVNKISYDSHDYPPPSYFQQQTSNFLPTPAPEKPPTPAPPSSSPHQHFRRPPSPSPAHSAIFLHQQPQQQYSQPSQAALPNYANSIDNYLLNKQQPSKFYRTETPQPQIPYQHENRPPPLEYDFPQYTASPPNGHEQEYFSRPPPLHSAQKPYHQYESARPPPGRPSYNNYYDYQIGEIPPFAQTTSQHYNYPYPRPPPSQYPYRPPLTPPPNQQSGLATLAQYAPQFTSLLLGGAGGGGGNSNINGPLGSLIGALTGAATSQQPSSSTSPASFNRRPVNSQLIKALENIARNDDLQCVPKVVCQMIAAQTQRGQLPTFITSPAITNFLAGFPTASPALIYGRAALLGLSGGDKSCHQTYVKCPKDEYEIIYYLNNHRGGFFKFFSEPEEQQQPVSHGSMQQSAPSLFSILSALAGAPQTTTTTPRPTPKPQPPPADITSGIGNFFTQLLSDYVGGAAVEYQRSTKRRAKRSLDGEIKFEGQHEEGHSNAVKFQDETSESQGDVIKFKDQLSDQHQDSQPESDEDFHDEEDEEDTQHGLDFKDSEPDYAESSESRILHKNLGKGKRIILFPETIKDNVDEIDIDEELKQKIKRYNNYNKERKLKFPTATDDRMYTEVTKHELRGGKFLYEGSISEDLNYGHQFTNYVENSVGDFVREKQKVKFADAYEGGDNQKHEQLLYTNYVKDHETLNPNIIFPTREGKIVNHVHYAASYLQDYTLGQKTQEAETEPPTDEFVLPNDQTSVHYTQRPPAPSFNTFNTYSKPWKIQSSHFLPTAPPPTPSQANDFASTNSIYSNQQNYSNNEHKQSSNWKYPSVGSSSSLHFSNNDIHKPPQSNSNRYHTTRRPYTPEATTEHSDSKNIYVTNSRGVTEYFITPDGRKIYL